VDAVQSIGGKGFDPGRIYRREAPGVVTVISVLSAPGGSIGRAVGSGFVLDGNGEIATNAHVVSDGEGSSMRPAREVYVQFADQNQVPARVVGVDPYADVALIRVSARGLTLRPLPLGSSKGLKVGAPVVVLGSPFGEPQSLSVGVISATDRSIESLTAFSISDAIQTDAAINQGNSGGPLVDARGRVLGINAQIAPGQNGENSGVGFAVPVDTAKRSLDQLRQRGRVSYAYLGVATVALYPQLARRAGLPVTRGAWLQDVVNGGPADDAGLRGGSQRIRFQAQRYETGGDVIVAVDGRRLRDEADIGRAIESKRPGETVTLEIVRDGRRRQVSVKLGNRPLEGPRRGP
jgi:S1-C subfamily serine protease